MRMFDRRRLLAAAAVGMLAAPALAQDDKTKLRDMLLELEIGSWQFTKDKNAAAMNGFLADDAVLVMGDGGRFTKAEFVKFPFEVSSFTVDRASAQVLVASPDTAILLYRVTYTGRDKGGPAMTSKVAASDAYVRRGGRWQSLYYQETPLK